MVDICCYTQCLKLIVLFFLMLLREPLLLIKLRTHHKKSSSFAYLLNRTHSRIQKD